MHARAQQIERLEADGLTIGQVSELVGVPVPTLRSWERRYQIPFEARPDGVTRRYRSVDVEMLILMRDDISRGVRAGDAAASVRGLFDRARPSWFFVAGLLEASQAADAALITDWLDRAAAELGLGKCLDEVLFPAMRRIGLSWRNDRHDVAREDVSTDAVCRWLRRQAAVAALAPDPPLVLLVSADQHNIGLHALGALLHHRQIRCRGLSNGLSAAGLSAAVGAWRPGAVVLLSHLAGSRGHCVQWLSALQSSGSRVFYAGNAFSSPRARRGVPGAYLGLNVSAAAALVEAAVLGQ